jgi:SagB-type dehydrogenase family enzyme
MAERDIHELPPADLEAGGNLVQALQERRTVRGFNQQGLTRAQVAQLLWAAQGITSPEGKRTAPSAGALYPLEVRLVAGDVEGLTPGSYRYDPAQHRLVDEQKGELRPELTEAALSQEWIRTAPAIFVISAVYARTTGKYGDRGKRYVYMEVGHAAQSLLLQATALGLSSATVGAFDDAQLKRLLQLPADEEPLIILPVGH